MSAARADVETAPPNPTRTRMGRGSMNNDQFILRPARPAALIGKASAALSQVVGVVDGNETYGVARNAKRWKTGAQVRRPLLRGVLLAVLAIAGVLPLLAQSGIPNNPRSNGTCAS